MAENKPVGVTIVADTSRLKTGLGGAQKMFGAFAASVAAIGATAFFKNVADTADRITKMSRDIGITTREADALTHGFEMAGLSVSSAEITFKKFASSLTMAERGSAQLRTTLASIGLDAVALQGKTSYEALQLAAKGMKDLNAIEKAGVGRELFGRAGSRAVEAILDMPKMQGFIDDLYGKFGLSDKGANDIEAMNDSVTTLQKTFELLGRSILQDLAPTITYLMGAIAKAASIAGGEISNLTLLMKHAGAESARMNEGFVATGARGIGSLLMSPFLDEEDREFLRKKYVPDEQGVSTMDEFSEDALRTAERLFDSLKTSTEKFHDVLEQLNTAVDQGSIDYGEYTDLVREAHRQVLNGVPAIKSSADAIAEQRKELDELFSANLLSVQMYQDANRALTESLPEYQEAQRLTEQFRTEQERLAEAFEKLQKLYSEGFLSEETMQRAVQQIHDELAAADPMIAEQEARLQAFHDALKDAELGLDGTSSSTATRASTGGLSEILGRAAQSGHSIEREQVDEQKKANEYLKRIAEAQQTFAVYA